MKSTLTETEMTSTASERARIAKYIRAHGKETNTLCLGGDAENGPEMEGDHYWRLGQVVLFESGEIVRSHRSLPNSGIPF